MSAYTAEGTAFEDGACRACGADSYGMLSDGPRCHGCKRFVLKDTGVDCGQGVSEHASLRGPLTREALEERLREVEARAGIEALFGAWPFGSGALSFDDDEDHPLPRRRTWRKPKRWQGRPASLKTVDALTEAETILKEARR